MKRSEFALAVEQEFGPGYGDVVVNDVVLVELGNRTAREALHWKKARAAASSAVFQNIGTSHGMVPSIMHQRCAATGRSGAVSK